MNDTKEIREQPQTGEGIYLFCFAFPDLPPTFINIGVDERYPVTQMRVKDIVAVLSRVSLEDFSGSSLERNLQEISWVGPLAYRHQTIVSEVMVYSSVLPARFGTIFSSLRRLEKRMLIHYTAIDRFLHKVVNKEEWAVKGFLDREIARKHLTARNFSRDDEQLSTLPPGKQYFQKKRAVSTAEKTLNQQLKSVLEEAWSHLKSYASDCCERNVLSRNATGKDVDMVMNWAYLISQEGVKDFCGCIDRINSRQGKYGLTFELTGPWPPYSFCPALDLETA